MKRKKKVPIFAQLGCADWGEMEELVCRAESEKIITLIGLELLARRFNWHDYKGRRVVRIKPYFDIAENAGVAVVAIQSRIQDDLAKIKEWQMRSSTPR